MQVRCSQPKGKLRLGVEVQGGPGKAWRLFTRGGGPGFWVDRWVFPNQTEIDAGGGGLGSQCHPL